MRNRILTSLGRFASERTWLAVAIIIVLTLFFGYLSENIEVTMNLNDLLPGEDPMVQEMNYIFQKFNGANTVFVVVEGKLDNMVDFAEHVSPMIENLVDWIDKNGSDNVKRYMQTVRDKAAAGKIEYEGNLVERVDFKQPVDFLQNHGLMLIKPKDLKNTGVVFTDPNLIQYVTNLNDAFEKEYIESEEKLSSTQREFSAVQFLDGIETWLDHFEEGVYSANYEPDEASQAAQAAAIGNPYLVSPDRTMLLMMVQPTFNMLEMDQLMAAINGLEELVKTEARDYHVEAGLAGGLALSRDEMVAATQDSYLLTILALIGVFILFIVTFRMLSSPFLAIINLIIGIIWAMGFSYFLVDKLNMFTVMMSVVLVGLGIDFSIHIISLFSELVNLGKSPHDAIIETMQKAGKGIITGAFTTAAAFLTLMVSRSDGMYEFGYVCGVGLIVIMITTLVVLPTLLMLRERYRQRRGKKVQKFRDVTYNSLGKTAGSIRKKWRISLVLILLLTLSAIYGAGKITMDYNYLNMEPVGLESIRLNNKIIDKFNFSADVTMMTSKSLEENYELTEKARKKPHISYIESVSDYLPLPEEQEHRKPGILEIARQIRNTPIKSSLYGNEVETFLSEMERLEMNVIEIQEMAYMGGQDMVDSKAAQLVGDPEDSTKTGKLTQFISRLEAEPINLQRLSQFNRDFALTFRNTVLNMADTSTIRIEDLPPIVKDKYISSDGERFLMTVYPKGNVWSIDYLEAFTKEVMDLTPSISGMPPVFYMLLKIIGEDGKRAILLTLVAVFAFLILDFRSFKYAVIAMLPLLLGAIWMAGVMGFGGIQLTLLNIMGIPLILGIGIDDGVHILHRYNSEGKGSTITVFRSTGKAVTITTLTTMLAFGSLVFATYRGYGSLGIAVALGTGMCLLATIALIPALIGLVEKGTRN